MSRPSQYRSCGELVKLNALTLVARNYEFVTNHHCYSPSVKLGHYTRLESWVGGISRYATLVVLVPRHHDVATHTPVGTPAMCMHVCNSVCVCVCVCVCARVCMCTCVHVHVCVCEIICVISAAYTIS